MIAMNPYIIPTTCSVCGGPGMCHASYMVDAWLHGSRHKDPEVCAAYLQQKRRDLEAKEEELQKGKVEPCPQP